MLAPQKASPALCTILTIIAASILLGSLGLTPARGAEPGNAEHSPTDAVVAWGAGLDEKSALKQALENAIGQVLGSIIDADTIVKNEQVIREQILSDADAIVLSHDVVKGPTNAGGLVSLEIKAVVKRNIIVDRLVARHVVNQDAEGKSLFAKAAADLENEKDPVKIIRRAFENFPESVLQADAVGKFRVISKEEGSAIVGITIQFSIDPVRYSQWYAAVTPMLSKAATKVESLRYNPDGSREQVMSLSDFVTVQHWAAEDFADVPNDNWRTSFQVVAFDLLPREALGDIATEAPVTLTVLEQQGSSKATLLYLDHAAQFEMVRASCTVPTVEIVLLDEKGNTIESQTRVCAFDKSTSAHTGHPYVISPFFRASSNYIQTMWPLAHVGMDWKPDESAFARSPTAVVMPYFAGESRGGALLVSGLKVEFPIAVEAEQLQHLKKVQVKISGTNNVKQPG